MAVQQITDTNFKKDVLENDNLILVDFWAEWCGPCRAIAPVLDQVAEALADDVTIYKMNIDENPETPGSLGVRSIPTLILFKDGKNIATQVGAMSKPALEDWIRQYAK